jgi:hypothetical protein
VSRQAVAENTSEVSNLSIHRLMGALVERPLTGNATILESAVALSRGEQGGVLRSWAEIAAASSVKACVIRCRGSRSVPIS